MSAVHPEPWLRAQITNNNNYQYTASAQIEEKCHFLQGPEPADIIIHNILVFTKRT
jgi:hypothetical protein